MNDEILQAAMVLTNTYLSDKKIAELTGFSERTIADRRREAGLLPSQSQNLGDNGKVWTLKAYNDYLAYRGTREWRKELEKAKKMRDSLAG